MHGLRSHQFAWRCALDSNEISEVNWDDEPDLNAIVARMRIDPMIKAKHQIAWWIVVIFAASLGVSLVGGIAVCVAKSPTEAEQIITKAYLPLLQGLGGFMSTVFGPLLAFILGYFFRQQNGQ